MSAIVAALQALIAPFSPLHCARETATETAAAASPSAATAVATGATDTAPLAAASPAIETAPPVAASPAAAMAGGTGTATTTTTMTAVVVATATPTAARQTTGGRVGGRRESVGTWTTTTVTTSP